MNHAYVEWQNCEFGAPAIDPKRPYGNSDVISDIHEILANEIVDDPTEWEHDNPVLLEKYKKLHKETAIALQLLCQGFSELGNYQCEEYSNEWVPQCHS